MLTLIRHKQYPRCTCGSLYYKGEFICHTLEPVDRGLTDRSTLSEIRECKAIGVTAIPTGIYQLTTQIQSPKYSVRTAYQVIRGFLPRLLNVQGYEGILIHIGNFPSDTLGCILVGTKDDDKERVYYSTQAFWKVYNLIKDNNVTSIRIMRDFDNERPFP